MERMKPTYDANAEIALAEVDIEFPKEGLSSRAQVLPSLSPVPNIGTYSHYLTAGAAWHTKKSAPVPAGAPSPK